MILQMIPLMNLKLSMYSDQLTVNRHSLRIQLVQHMIFPFYLGTPIASDTAEVEDETPQDTELKTPVPVRRSVRKRRKPAWLTSDQYDVSKSATCIKQTSLQQQIP